MSLLGLPIGFYGYMFPGNINLMVLELYGSKKYKMLFIILALIVFFESSYAIVSLFYLNKVKENVQLYTIIEIVSYLLILVMGIWMLFENKNNNQVSQKNTLYRGILSIIIHPQQIPFWLIIGVVVNPIINFGMDITSILGFLFFNAIGTLLVMLIYMIYGNRLMHYFKLKLNLLNTIMGALYISLALFSVTKLFINS
jgi:hypothetical protein